MSVSPQNVRSAALTYGPTIDWSTGDHFNGYALLALCPPTSSGTNWPTLGQVANNPQTRLPLWVRVPIINGRYDNAIKIIFNEDIDPPNTRYAAYFYDLSNQRVAPAGTPTMFEIDADPYTLTPPTLTAPIAPVTPPSPEST